MKTIPLNQKVPQLRMNLKNVEVFQTNVIEEKDACKLSEMLQMEFPDLDIHFDLEDCDNILRVEGYSVSCDRIASLMLTYGYQCKALL